VGACGPAYVCMCCAGRRVYLCYLCCPNPFAWRRERQGRLRVRGVREGKMGLGGLGRVLASHSRDPAYNEGFYLPRPKAVCAALGLPACVAIQPVIQSRDLIVHRLHKAVAHFTRHGPRNVLPGLCCCFGQSSWQGAQWTNEAVLVARVSSGSVTIR
jgi:hypothetical protein